MRELRVILDTSALLLSYEGVDVLEELSKELPVRVEYFTLDTVVDELRALSKRRGSWRGRAAKFVLENIIGRIKVINTELKGLGTDESILEFIRRNPDYVVVTLDNELKERLRRCNVKVITWWHGKRKFIGVE